MTNQGWNGSTGVKHEVLVYIRVNCTAIYSNRANQLLGNIILMILMPALMFWVSEFSKKAIQVHWVIYSSDSKPPRMNLAVFTHYWVCNRKVSIFENYYMLEFFLPQITKFSKVGHSDHSFKFSLDAAILYVTYHRYYTIFTTDSIVRGEYNYSCDKIRGKFELTRVCVRVPRFFFSAAKKFGRVNSCDKIRG